MFRCKGCGASGRNPITYERGTESGNCASGGKPYYAGAMIGACVMNVGNCYTCKYWDDFFDEPDAKPREGSCRRFPPVRNMSEDCQEVKMHELWSFPVTGAHWWCGEFKRDTEQEPTP